MIIEAHPHPYYTNSDDEDTLLTQFANRTFLLSVDESVELEEAIYLRKYQLMLSEKVRALKSEVPKYTYQMFIKAVYCPYYVVFDKHYTTDEKNHNAIWDWQTRSLQKIVTYDYLHLIATIQNHCRNLTDPLSYILSQKEFAEALLDNAELNIETIKRELLHLDFIPVAIYDGFDDDKLLECLNKYRSHDLHLQAVTPNSISVPLKLIGKKHDGIINNELSIFYLVDKIADWLGKVIDGLPLYQSVKEPKWTELISSTRYKAKKEVKSLTKIIEDKVYDDILPSNEIEIFLIAQFEIYRERFNDFEHKDFFCILKEGNEQVLNRTIQTNAFFGNDIEGQLGHLYNAIVILEMSWAIVQIYGDIFDTHRIKYPDEDGSHASVLSLTNSMVLDKELYQALVQSLDDFMLHFQNYNIPFDMLSRNQKDNMHHIFHRAITGLQGVLNDAEPSNKILYLQTRLKELRQRELQMKEFTEDRLGDYDDRYSLFLQDFLKLEADFIKETKNISPVLPLKLTTNKLILALPVSPSFESLLNDTKAGFILKLMEDLGITQNGGSVISTRKKGAIRGIVEALLESSILPANSLELLCKTIADKIGLELKSKLDTSDISETYKKKAHTYIKDHYIA